MSDPRAPGRYEASDAEARPLFVLGLALALLVAASMVLSAWIGRRFDRELEAEAPASSLRDLRRAPVGPELQAVPAHELVLQRTWEQELVSGTAWVDPVNGIVRIPIERAMDLVLAEGFPVRHGAAATEER